MSEVSDNRYDRGDHGHDTNPETAHTKPAIVDSHYYFDMLIRYARIATIIVTTNVTTVA
jgi:hypothetical protein